MNELSEGAFVETTATDNGTLAVLNRTEIDQQITTAKRYPRDVSRFIKRATELVTLNESIAQQCIYALPRDGKTIEGPSARMAEVIVNAWGNARAGARVVSDTGDFITAQGVFHDLEQNVAITYEVQRRITNKRGERFGSDMIGVTGNAACSIALRNAILKGVPKAYWDGIYKKARAVVAGTIETLANKRANAIKEFVIFGINEAQILGKLGKLGVADINTDDLVLLFGMLTAIKDGDMTSEDAFPQIEGSTTRPGVEMPTGKSLAGQVVDAEFVEPVSKRADALPADDKPMTDGQKKILRAKRDNGALSDMDIKTKFGKGLDDTEATWSFSEFAAVQAFIANPKGE